MTHSATTRLRAATRFRTRAVALQPGFPVQVERDGGCPAGGAQADQALLIISPPKMMVPVVLVAGEIGECSHP